MIKKRMAAAVVAATMLLNVTPVMASVVTPQAASSGSVTVTSDATVGAYDNTPVYKVTLPTAEALKFTVDPYGLLQLATGESMGLDAMSASGGAILTASGSAALIKNESSEDIKVDVKLQALVSGGATVSFLDKGSEVASGTAANMCLAFIPSATKAAVESSYVAADYALSVVKDSRKEVSFKLNKAEYKVKNTGSGFKLEIATGEANYDATAFKVGGCVNPKADWSAFTASGGSTLSLSAVFEYNKSTDGVVVDDSKGYGFVSGSATLTDDFSLAPAAPISGTGMVKASESNIDYVIEHFKIGSNYVIKVNEGTIVSLKGGTSLGNYVTPIANQYLDNTNHTATVPANTFGSGAIGQARYIRLELDSKVITIKVMCEQ